MHNSAKAKEQLLQQMAVRQASQGEGSAFFNLLFPFSIVVAFSAFYATPLGLLYISKSEPDWLNTYLFWSPPVITIVACSLYGFLRRKRLDPIVEKLRAKFESGESV